MRRSSIIAIVSILSLIIILVIYQYVFSIYEIIYTIEPLNLYADSRSTVVVKAVPLNSFGKQAPFRTVKAEYNIREGAELVHIVERNSAEGILVLRAKDKAGTVVITASAAKSLLPSVIEIQIYPPLAQNIF